jgi:hypothetical protein
MVVCADFADLRRLNLRNSARSADDLSFYKTQNYAYLILFVIFAIFCSIIF